MKGAATVILAIVVLIMIGIAVVFLLGFLARAHGAILSPGEKDMIAKDSMDDSSNNTTFLPPNRSGNLAPALCCHQFGEGDMWGDVRR